MTISYQKTKGGCHMVKPKRRDEVSKMAIIYEQWEVSKMDEMSKDGYHV